jgi:hypothetical protein
MTAPLRQSETITLPTLNRVVCVRAFEGLQRVKKGLKPTIWQTQALEQLEAVFENYLFSSNAGCDDGKH